MEEIQNWNFYFNQTTSETSIKEDSFKNTNYYSESILSINLNDTHLNYNNSNATSLIPHWGHAYKPVIEILLLVSLILIMFAMGCDIKWRNLLYHLKHPMTLSLGILSQFVIMPLSAFCMLLMSNIQSFQATAVLIISCCPGGVLSNTFTYFCEGNLPLSVAMTCISTALAMGMMPLNIWLYGRYFETENLVIPYKKMAMSLLIVTSPALLGMLVKQKFPRFAKFTTKFGSYCSLAIVFVCVGVEVFLFPNMFQSISFKLYVVTLTLPAIGLALGYSVAAVLKQDKDIRKTIAIECGIQNAPIAIAIIVLSFPFELQGSMISVPLLYGFSMMIICTVICLAYHTWKKYFKKTPVDVLNANGVKLDSLLGNTENGEHMNGIKIEIKPSDKKKGEYVLKSDTSV